MPCSGGAIGAATGGAPSSISDLNATTPSGGNLLSFAGSAGEGSVPPEPMDASASGGMGGAGSLSIGDDCESPFRDVILERLQLAVSGLCVEVGDWAPLLLDDDTWAPSYRTALTTCRESLRQSWAIQLLSGDDGQGEGYEFRNESTNLNLDVRFASPNEGTPIVLYQPHRLYNQRFTLKAGQNGTFKLSPLHAPEMCLAEVEASLELAPCTVGFNEQSFRRVGCRDAPP